MTYTKEFGRCATQLSDESFADDEDWEPYFMMQHHGVPIRLLDWSDGALIALHFAVGRKTASSESGSVVHCTRRFGVDPDFETTS
jgi:hypothetical protein